MAHAIIMVYLSPFFSLGNSRAATREPQEVRPCMIVRQPMSTFQHYVRSLSRQGRNPPEADMLTEATDTAAACELLITPYLLA